MRTQIFPYAKGCYNRISLNYFVELWQEEQEETGLQDIWLRLDIRKTFLTIVVVTPKPWGCCGICSEKPPKEESIKICQV